MNALGLGPLLSCSLLNSEIVSSLVPKMIQDAHKELSNIVEWMRMKKPSPNPQKSKFMIIGHSIETRNPEFPENLELGSSDITRVDETKYLRVITDETWTGMNSLTVYFNSLSALKVT